MAEPASIQSMPWNELKAVSFRLFEIEGNLGFSVILLIDRDLDRSMYKEDGNIIASRVSYELAKKTGKDFFISPPVLAEKLSNEFILSLKNQDIHSTEYHHLFNKQVIKLKCLYHSFESDRHGGNL